MVILTETSQGSSSSSDVRYDVYLSFRGADTRHGFTDHLNNALIGADLVTYLDFEKFEIGKDLKQELENAIKSSRASVIVFSQSYADSTWCLDELVLIFDQHLTSGRIVIPVYYHVDPSDVRGQRGRFGYAMEKHIQKMEAERNAEIKSQWAQRMEKWKKALTKVACLAGIEVNDRSRPNVSELLLRKSVRLGLRSRNTLPQLIGMDDSIDFVRSWLEDGSTHTADILTIVGMGGIGKTFLAKLVYLLHCDAFIESSFIEDISLRCLGQYNGLLGLQKQLFADISRRSSNQVHDFLTYTTMIENALAHKKVLLVLDGVDNFDQLDVLLGNKGFHPGSKIMITTRDASLTERCALFNSKVQPMHTKHLLKGLDKKASRRLLCVNAFNEDPHKDYERVSDNIVKYCDGHPLALVVLGRYLHNRDVFYWEEYIEGLKKQPVYLINDALRRSYDNLSYNDKELFLHVVSFFVGMDRDITETILKACNINTRSGITNLVDRCLLHIGSTTELTMHSLIQKMGRDLVCQESPAKPWKRSRLWCHEESYEVIEQKKGTKSIKGLALDMRMIEKEGLPGSLFELETDALSKMDNLKLLQLNYVQLNGSYKNFPRKLRWLCMHGFPLKSVPSDLPMQNLAVLDMSYSNIESFDMSCRNLQRPAKRQKLTCSNGQKLLGSLKVLNLSYCDQLHSVGGFCELPALESLYLTNCMSLIEVCESIEQCEKLVLIDLSYCKEYRKLPKTIEKLKNLKSLLLDGCNLGETRDIDSLEMLNADSSDITAQTSSSAVEENILRDVLEAPSSSSSPNDNTYDVFISFRGTDTRLGFTAHLHRAFKEANIGTFYYDKEIETELYLKSELERAIKASRAYVVVLSKTYASSPQCLEELVSILEQRRNSKRIVIPIFYHVEPTHFRKQQKSFVDPMAEHRQKMEAETNAEVKSQLAHKIERYGALHLQKFLI